MVNTVYTFRESRRENVESVCNTDLVAVRAMDAGFFGCGCYTTLNVEYAARYALGDFDPPVPGVRASPDGRFPVIILTISAAHFAPVGRR